MSDRDAEDESADRPTQDSDREPDGGSDGETGGSPAGSGEDSVEATVERSAHASDPAGPVDDSVGDDGVADDNMADDSVVDDGVVDDGVADDTVGVDGSVEGTATADQTVEDRIDVEEVLADEPLGESRRLNAKVRYQWLVGTTVAAAVSAVFVAGVFQVSAGTVGIDPTGSLPFGLSRTTVLVAVVAFLLFEALAALRAVLLYRSWRYEVREDSLYLTRGVLTRVQTVAPYVRVQHIDTRRSPFERVLGLSSLVVYTAGSRGADVTVPGLTDDRAAELQRHLKLLAIASEEDDAV